MLIIGAGPLHHGEYVIVKQRSAVEHFLCRLQFLLLDSRVAADFQQHADQPAASKRDAHPYPGLQYIRVRTGGWQVVKAAVQW